MTLREWAFLMFAGKLRETLSSFSCHAFFPQCPQRAHSRPGSVTNTKGIRMSKSECLQPGGSQSVRDRFISVPVGAQALHYSRMDSLSSEHSTFERLSLCGGGGVRPGRQHRVSVVLLWPGWCSAVLACLTIACLPSQALLREDAPHADSHRTQVRVSRLLVPMRLQIASESLRRIFMTKICPDVQP